MLKYTLSVVRSHKGALFHNENKLTQYSQYTDWTWYEIGLLRLFICMW